ncbi:MAG: dTDP-4-dehydrorhamnose 3,5-epimerase [Bdellovibrionota bacterium]
MKIIPLELPDLMLVELDFYGDQRGFFLERFNKELFAKIGLPVAFAQLNHSRSSPKVLRGLHYQFNPPQGKLIGVVHGAIWDVAVDIRPDSPTFGKHATVELSDINGKLLFIPSGFAHGFCVLGNESADVLYMVDNTYNPHGEGGILWSDPQLKINWPVSDPIISAKDQKQPSFEVYRTSQTANAFNPKAHGSPYQCCAQYKRGPMVGQKKNSLDQET